MKKNYLFFLLLFIAYWSQAQIVNIPDTNFKNYVLNTNLVDTNNDDIFDSDIDINNDGEVQESEALLVTEMKPISRNIASFEGLQYFTNLEIFECSNNPITSLSLTQNVNLKSLLCTNFINSNSLTSLDITQNVLLESLTLSSNDLLSTLDITQNVNLESLTLRNCNFSSLDVSQNINLKNLYCQNNSLTSIDLTQNASLENINFDNNQLTSLDVTQNGSLESVFLLGNPLTSIDVTQNANLTTFSVVNTNVASIDVTQNANLQNFYCGNTSITSIDVTQNPNLIIFSCNDNNLTSIDVTQNPNIDWIECSNNQLTTLDFSQNPNLQRASCNDNLLATINLNGATSLRDFYINNNPLTALDVTNNSNLKYFECNNTTLTQLDITGNPALETLQCNNNSLTQLDLSQNVVLESLDCSNNSLTILDTSQNPELDIVNCNANQLTYLNVKNGIRSNVFGLTFANNPTLEFICVDENELADIAASSSVPATAVVSTYCSFVPGGDYITVQGTSTVDSNSDGCDMTDPIYPNMELSISNGFTADTVIADTSGDYAIYLATGITYTITPQLENPTYFTVSPVSVAVNTSAASSPVTLDFCVTPSGTHDDVEVIIMPIEQARPGFDTDYKIIYKNKGNTTLSGTIQLIFDDALLDLVTANPMVATQALNTLTWNYTNLAPFETGSIDFTMNINSPVEVPAVNDGDILSFEATITPTATDETPDDNIMVLQQTVVNSLDPNDITCLEGETITTDYIDEYVHYLIRFENTGTASAVNVVVSDYIDTTKLDISTLMPVASSHMMETRINTDNLVEFIFENINLPFDDATNDGYIVFKIKTVASLVENDTFSNKADIYFDFNLPIATNTASTLISNGLSVASADAVSQGITLYPNPTRDQLYISSTAPIETITLQTLEGRNVIFKTTQATGFSNTLNISNLPSGMYLVNITTTEGITIKKVVKQ
jgi:Leucine-rich repeat (LRR) protein